MSPDYLFLLGLGVTLLVYHFAIMVHMANVNRYIYPLIPMIYLVCSVGAVEIVARVRDSRRGYAE